MRLYGDAGIIDDDGRGGNDTITGGSASVVLIYGDADGLNGHARGGDDTLTGSATSFTINVIFGDAGTMDGDSRGGDDILVAGGVIGGFGSSLVMGDAGTMRDSARGGNDTLTGGAGSDNTLYGDARLMYDNATGGDDTLISGAGTDHMWGDAQFINDVLARPTADTGLLATGADTFVFAPGSGNDDIGDFRQSDHDRIDVRAYGFSSLADMMITFDGTSTRIHFDANNSVTLVGFSDLSALSTLDFILA